MDRMRATVRSKSGNVKAKMDPDLGELLDVMCREDMETRSAVIRRLILGEYRRRFPQGHRKPPTK